MNNFNIEYRGGEKKIRIRKKEEQVAKKEGITRIRCDALTIHQERRYLSAMNISKNGCNSTILNQKCNLSLNLIDKPVFL